MSSLRAELLGGKAEVPEFRLALPPGWTAHDTSEETERTLLRKARTRLLAAKQPAALPQLEESVRRSMEDARRQGAFVMIVPGEGAPDWAYVPVSVLGSLVSSTPEFPLDRVVADAIERRGAKALDQSKHFLRWEDRRSVRRDGDGVSVFTVLYMTPVPETGRSKALRFTATFPHASDVDPTQDPAIGSWVAMFDACFSTFTWNVA